MLSYLLANSTTILTVIGAVVTCATTIVHIFPSQRANTILADVIKVMNWVSVVEAKPAV